MMKIRTTLAAAATLCCAGLAFGQSANDLCANAQALTINTPTSGAIVAADTNDSPTNTATNNGCGTTFLGTTRKSVYYTFVPTTSGLHEVSTCASTGTLTDTRLAIWAATDVTPGAVAPCTGSVAALACNDDSCGARSNFNVNLTAGVGYIIQVAPFSTTSTGGTFTILVAGPQSSPAPANDDCAAAASLSNGVATAGSLTNATGVTTTVFTCGSTSTTGNDVWYSVTPSVAGTASIDVCGNFDSIVNVLTAASTCAAPASAACNDDTIPTGCTLHGSRATWTAVAGTTYLVRVAGVQHSTSTPSGIAPAHGDFTITFSEPLPSGTCCNSITGACTFVTQATCGTGGTWTIGGSCTPSPCPVNGACCLNSCCSVVIASQCALIGGTYQGDATTCTTNPCTAVPANDLCTAAIPVTVGTLVYGSNCGATPTTATDLPAPTCQSSFSRTVWYTVTPSTTGFYNLSICGASFDSVLDVFTTPDCVAFTAVACDDDACAGGEPGPVGSGSGLASVITAAQLDAGTTYYIRISSFGTTASGNFQLLVSSNTTAGACCNSTTGACTISLTGSAGCGSGSTFLGGLCSPNPCPQPTGACCTPNGACGILSGADCTTAGGLFQGPASTCGAMGECPVAVGSCCNNITGVCTYILGSATCSGGTFTAGGLCSPNSCPQPGACCLGTCCSITLQSACTGTWGPANSTCTPGICGAVANDECSGAIAASVGANAGSNCGANTSFVITPTTQCGTFAGSGGAADVWMKFTPTQSANYTLNTCATPGFDTVLALYESCPADGSVAPRACNDDTAGTCAVSTLRSEIPNQLLLAGQTYYIRIAAYNAGTPAEGEFVLNITQGAAAGACCDTSGACTITLNFDCSTGYQGDFTTCSPNPCTPPTATCCRGATCSVVLPANCTVASGTAGVATPGGTTCNVSGNATTPCCYADYNKTGGITINDIFDFLNDWFAGSPYANTGGDGTTPPAGVNSIFDFLNAWFAGGC